MSCRRQYLLLCWALLVCLLLTACGGAPAGVTQKAASDQHWFSRMQAGRSAFDQGHDLLASRLFQQALERGRQMDRAEQIVDAAFNLAAVQIQLGDFAAARRSLQQAKGASRQAGTSLSEILLLEAKAARLQGDSEQARGITDRLLLRFPEAEPRQRSQAKLLSGLLACEAGDISRATQDLVDAVALNDKESPPAIVATQAELQGCLHLLRGRPLEAAGEFDRESSYLRQAHKYRQMVNALHKAGSTFALAGDNQQAADRLFRAARSALSQKRLRQAQQWINQAESAALAADSRLLLEQIARLRTELANSSSQ